MNTLRYFQFIYFKSNKLNISTVDLKQACDTSSYLNDWVDRIAGLPTYIAW